MSDSTKSNSGNVHRNISHASQNTHRKNPAFPPHSYQLRLGDIYIHMYIYIYPLASYWLPIGSLLASYWLPIDGESRICSSSAECQKHIWTWKIDPEMHNIVCCACLQHQTACSWDDLCWQGLDQNLIRSLPVDFCVKAHALQETYIKTFIYIYIYIYI